MTHLWTKDWVEGLEGGGARESNTGGAIKLSFNKYAFKYGSDIDY